MLVPANVGFQEENSTPEGLERVMGMNSAGANELPEGVRNAGCGERRLSGSEIG